MCGQPLIEAAKEQNRFKNNFLDSLCLVFCVFYSLCYVSFLKSLSHYVYRIFAMCL